MTRPWWDNPRAEAHVSGGVPVLLPGGRKAAIEALQARIAGFVPEWRDLTEDDAGVALTRIFGLQLEQILNRVERLPEKALVEFLRAAGLHLATARSAQTILVFTPDDTNDAPINVVPGARLTSARADGESGDVTWETDVGLTVPNLTLEERQVFDGEVALAIAEGEDFAPLGTRPEVGAALFLGLSGTGDVSGKLTIAFQPPGDDTPMPVAAGGPPPVDRPTAQLRWEVMTDSGFTAVDVLSDTTQGFGRTGIIEFVLPRNLTQDRPSILGGGDPLFWLRLRLAGGQIDPVPRIRAIYLHAVTATAKQTFRDEFPMSDTSANAEVIVQLSQPQVLSGSLVLEIDEGGVGGNLFDFGDEDRDEKAEDSFRRWTEVETLAGQRPDARVFTLDAAQGIIRFGDGNEGMLPPPGIRGIAVRSYATTLGAAGNVATEEITRMPVRLSGVSEVSNPFPATGGADEESRDTAIKAGPAILKARGRAVSAGDMALLARLAEGANVLKAYALSGIDPAFPGVLRPGTVGVFVVPKRHPSEPTDVPPVPSSLTLAAVASHLANSVGPLGARIVAGAPRYEEVRIEATVSLTEGADAAAAESAVRTALDRWLSPETGSWQIGATLRHADLTHVVLGAHEAVTAVPFLAVTLDGIGFAACTDLPLRPYSLPWPGRHRLVVEVGEAVQ